MKIFKKIFPIFFIFTVFLLNFAVSGCNNYGTLNFVCFNTSIYVAVSGGISKEEENAIKERLYGLENTLSVRIESSDVSKINSASEGEKTAVSEDAKILFNLSKEYYGFTDGKFNPAVYPLSVLWKLSAGEFDKTLPFVKPTDEEISNTLPLCGFSGITEDDGVVKTESGSKIDLGGIAKGYAVDKIAEILGAKSEGYISIGGSSIYVYSSKDDLSVKHPRKTGENVLTVKRDKIKGASISTSGDYERYYTDDTGKRYSHLIDGTTGRPADTGFQSVTVIDNRENETKSSAFTDALSTALCLMDKESLINFVKEKLSGFSVFAVFESKGEKLILTNEKQGNFTLLDDSYLVSEIN